MGDRGKLMIKIAIIGGGGFIGSTLANYFTNKANYKVTAIDLKFQKEKLNDNINLIECDVRDYNALEKALKDQDLVIYSAIIQIPMINVEKRLAFEVNTRGLINACEISYLSDTIKGFILTGSWHVFGENGLEGIINEEFGFRPDKVAERAKLYVLSKINQETIVRIYDEFSDKVFGVIRLATVLGNEMPKKTAANIFIENAINGRPLTPYNDSMYRPMLYVDINDVCRAFYSYSNKIIENKVSKNKNSIEHIYNILWPQPINIEDLANIIRDLVIEITNGNLIPKIEIIDTKKQILFHKEDKNKISLSVDKIIKELNLKELTDPKITLEKIIRERLKK
jgi:nucleoside-diphosphate-sugar epimerase